jgi:carboxypeptidase Taq
MEDVRITTRMDEADVFMMVYSAIHELGHAFYEQGLPPAQYGLPGGQACSLSFHESQSRVWENNLGRSREFWEGFFPVFAQAYPSALAGVSATDLYRAANRVEPSLVRVSADELTYHAHIQLRFELERALINGQMEVAELPQRWRQRMQSLLGIVPPTSREAELQDIHWSIGAFGYFPTYSLGSFYAAQLYATAQTQVPNLPKHVAAGNFAPFRDWLTQQVYAHGRQYDSETLCQLITGKPLEVKHFLEYLHAKLADVYALPTTQQPSAAS